MNSLSRRLERALPEDVVKRAKGILEKERITFAQYLKERPDGRPAIYSSAFSGFIAWAPSFKINPTVLEPSGNPQKRGGMIEAFGQLTETICSAASSGSFSRLCRVPTLLSNLWQLLNMYYVFQSFRETPPLCERAFCDAMEDPAEVSRYFFVLGEYLKAHPQVLNHLLHQIPEFSDLIFKEFTPHESCSEWVTMLHQCRHFRSPLIDRCRLLGCLFRCEAHRARHQFLFLLASIWERCVIHDYGPGRVFASRATDLLAFSTSSLESYLLCGDSAFHLLECNDPQRPPEESNTLMKTGGLTALIVALALWDYGSDTSAYALRKITDAQWEVFLSDDVLVQRIMDILLYAFDRHDWRAPPSSQIDGMNTVTGLMSRLLSQILRIKGLNFFHEACQQAWLSPRFYYLTKHFSRSPELYRSVANIAILYAKYPLLRLGVRRRYCAHLLDANFYKLEDIGSLGCIYESCQVKERLLKLAERRWKDESFNWNDLSDEEKTLIARWGCDVKFCSRCHFAVYCSRECQKADWTDNHRSECRGPEALKAVLPRMTSVLNKVQARYSDIRGGPKSPMRSKTVN